MTIVKVLVKSWPKPLDVIGVYAKDEEGEKILKRVIANMESLRPDWKLDAWEFQMNIPNM